MDDKAQGELLRQLIVGDTKKMDHMMASVNWGGLANVLVPLLQQAIPQILSLLTPK